MQLLVSSIHLKYFSKALPIIVLTLYMNTSFGFEDLKFRFSTDLKLPFRPTQLVLDSGLIDDGGRSSIQFGIAYLHGQTEGLHLSVGIIRSRKEFYFNSPANKFSREINVFYVGFGFWKIVSEDSIIVISPRVGLGNGKFGQNNLFVKSKALFLGIKGDISYNIYNHSGYTLNLNVGLGLSKIILEDFNYDNFTFKGKSDDEISPEVLFGFSVDF